MDRFSRQEAPRAAQIWAVAPAPPRREMLSRMRVYSTQSHILWVH